MHRLAVLLLLVAVLVAPLVPRSQVNAAPSDKIPAGALKATVVRAINGNTIVVERAGERQTVYLRLVDAPASHRSSVECFGKEATNRLRVMLPKGRTIYLERDPSDPGGAGSLLRYVWFKGIKGGVYLANEIMVREGYAILDDNQAILDEAATQGRGLDRLRTAQEAAAAKQAGWWTTCRGTAVAVAAALEAATLNTGAAATALGATEPDTAQDATGSDAGLGATGSDAALGATGSDAAGPVVPVRVAIPAIGVDAGIEQVGIVDGVMGT
ncbi:MAG: thermonuclease family protein, partial [Chloroflexota bacterium]|nr:thermonuclease family protein [Chloroflexota bacterium]